jgi:hypothetical protein
VPVTVPLLEDEEVLSDQLIFKARYSGKNSVRTAKCKLHGTKKVFLLLKTWH